MSQRRKGAKGMGAMGACWALGGGMPAIAALILAFSDKGGRFGDAGSAGVPARRAALARGAPSS